MAVPVLIGFWVVPTGTSRADEHRRQQMLIKTAQIASPIQVPELVSARIAGTWSGWYSYSDGRHSVPFEFQLTDTGGACRGVAEEPNTFGDKNFAKLSADLECDALELTPGKRVVFRKRYKNAKISHAVRYVGFVDADLRRIAGQWEIGETRGSFVIRR